MSKLIGPLQAVDGKRKTTYGYKMHANTDEDGFVKKMSYTPGNVHDSQEFDKLLDTYKTKDKIKTCGEVYADSAYANKKNNEKIGKQNNKVLHRAYRNKPLTKQQKQDNKQRSSIRYVVERTFGLLKLHRSSKLLSVNSHLSYQIHPYQSIQKL
ncbi:hypothetical protein, partial [uncultured Gammaproteobacteria bacterium]